MDVLITGSTGMVGKSVLQECINDKRVNTIYLINRTSVDLKSPKISEFIIIKWGYRNRNWGFFLSEIFKTYRHEKNSIY